MERLANWHIKPLFEEDFPQVANLVDQVLYWPTTFRKDILAILRVRMTPNESVTLREQLNHYDKPILDTLPFQPYYSTLQFELTPRRIYNIIGQILFSDILCSIFSVYLRTAPYGSDNWQELEEEEYYASFLKELKATQQPDRPQVLNYRAIMYPEARLEQYHPMLPANPSVNDYIRRQLYSFIDTLQSKILFPRYSKKSMSCETAHSVGETRISGAEVEYLYSVGVIVEGRVEMRQTWKGNDLTPRTYFAQGGSVYADSKYAQVIFNTLVDSLSCTHRTGRFNLSKFTLRREHVVILYDFSSFTSSMSEQKYFLWALGELCKGRMVTVFDTSMGLVEMDLGLYIIKYCDSVNNLTPFFIGPKLEKLDVSGDYYHKLAGFLGVYGNLASCTFLHGTVALYITGKEDSTSVVGDDALIAKVLTWFRETEVGEIPNDTTIEGTIEVIKTMGVINRNKFLILESPDDDDSDESLNQSSWVYLKRALTRFETHLRLGVQFDMVNLALVFEYRNTTRDYGHSDPLCAVATQITSLLLRVHDKAYIGDRELEILCDFLRMVYRKCGFPFRGAAPGTSFLHEGNVFTQDPRGARSSYRVEVTHYIIPVLPMSAYDCRRNPLEVLAESLSDEVMSLPKMVHVDDIGKMMSFSEGIQLFPSSTFETCGDPRLKFLRDFGYVETDDVRLEGPFSEADVLDVFLQMRSRNYRIAKTVTIISPVPVYYHY